MIAQPNPDRDNLHLIPLTPPMTGYEQFISAWLFLGEPSFLVDVGPASTTNILFDSLDQLGVTDLDFILLTHIHLDHAGAIGAVAARFDRAPIVCHAAGIPHLIDPERLWEGTQKVLGDIALGYGPIAPVAPKRLVDAVKFDHAAINPILTPGHAAHHVSYVLGDILFAGEAIGVRIDLGDDREYLRPATPPRFFLDTAISSLESLVAAAPRWLCYGHFGMGDDAVERLVRQRDQILFWEQAIGRLFDQVGNSENIEEQCIAMLLKEDPLLANFQHLPAAIHEREHYYLGNSIKGFLGWIKEKARRSGR